MTKRVPRMKSAAELGLTDEELAAQVAISEEVVTELLAEEGSSRSLPTIHLQSSAEPLPHDPTDEDDDDPCPNCGARGHGGLYLSAPGVRHCGCYHEGSFGDTEPHRTALSDADVVRSVLRLEERLAGEEARAALTIRNLRGLLDAAELCLADPAPPGYGPFQAVAHAAADLAAQATRVDTLRRLRDES
jgi:hypothetical protein